MDIIRLDPFDDPSFRTSTFEAICLVFLNCFSDLSSISIAIDLAYFCHRELFLFKATSGPDGMHIALPLSGYFNLGDGLACDVKIFDRKVIIKPGSLTIVGINWGPMRHYTFAEGACIVAINGKLTAYGIKRSQ